MKTIDAMLRWFFIAAGVLTLGVVILSCIPYSRSKRLSNGATIRITQARLAEFAGRTISKVSYRGRDGKTDRVDFWADGYDYPVDVIPSSDGQSLLYVYDADISVRIFKVDPSRLCDPAGATANVKKFVSFSTWHIEEASLADWKEAQDYFKKLPNPGWFLDYANEAIRRMEEGEPPAEGDGFR